MKQRPVDHGRRKTLGLLLAGIVEFHGVFDSAISTSGYSAGWIEHSSRGRVIQSNIIGANGTEAVPSLSLVTIIDLAINDYLVVKVYQTGGATETLIAGAGGNEYSQYFAAQKIG